MLMYLTRRILYAIAVLFAVSILMFFMSALAPGDLVESHLTLEGLNAYRQQSYSERSAEYTRTARRLGTDIPVFYFTVQPACFPDTLFHIVQKEERQAAKSLLLRHGHPAQFNAYREAILRCLVSSERISDTARTTQITTIGANAAFLLSAVDTGQIHFLLSGIHDASSPDSPMRVQVAHLEQAYQELADKQARVTDLIPVLRWNGTTNQYHRWISRVLTGDLGTSLIDGRAVSTKIREAIRWTLSINLIAILLAFGIAIPLGIATSRRAGSKVDKTISGVLFAFYAMPAFWLAMLCIVFLTTSQYASWLDLFPTGGVGMVTPGMSLWERITLRISHLALPVFCLLAGSLAFLTRQMRGSMLRELRQDYIRLARAKGLKEWRVIWKHAGRNALFPMITMLGSAFPAAISGSVILEVIFSIPGMGRLLYMSILSKDWPVVYAMVLLAAFLTVFGYFIADVLYRKADPRVQFHMTR